MLSRSGFRLLLAAALALGASPRLYAEAYRAAAVGADDAVATRIRVDCLNQAHPRWSTGDSTQTRLSTWPASSTATSKVRPRPGTATDACVHSASLKRGGPTANGPTIIRPAKNALKGSARPVMPRPLGRPIQGMPPGRASPKRGPKFGRTRNVFNTAASRRSTLGGGSTPWARRPPTPRALRRTPPRRRFSCRRITARSARSG